MISRGGASVTWFAYNQPNRITQPGGNNSRFLYAPDRSRYSEVNRNGTTTEAHLEFAGRFDRVSSSVDRNEY